MVIAHAHRAGQLVPEGHIGEPEQPGVSVRAGLIVLISDQPVAVKRSGKAVVGSGADRKIPPVHRLKIIAFLACRYTDAPVAESRKRVSRNPRCGLEIETERGFIFDGPRLVVGPEAVAAELLMIQPVIKGLVSEVQLTREIINYIEIAGISSRASEIRRVD